VSIEKFKLFKTPLSGGPAQWKNIFLNFVAGDFYLAKALKKLYE